MQHAAQIFALECPACHDLRGRFSPYSISVDGNLKISNWARSRQLHHEPHMRDGWVSPQEHVMQHAQLAQQAKGEVGYRHAAVGMCVKSAVFA